MRKIITFLITVFLFAFFLGAAVKAEETTEQIIKNEHAHAQIVLNSQITADGKIKKQEITNTNSKFNISINRNTYKFYCCTKEEIK